MRQFEHRWAVGTMPPALAAILLIMFDRNKLSLVRPLGGLHGPIGGSHKEGT